MSTRELAEQVGARVRAAIIQNKLLLEPLVDAAELAVREASMQAMLLNAGDVRAERDKAWVLGLGALFPEGYKSVVPRTPDEIVQLVKDAEEIREQQFQTKVDKIHAQATANGFLAGLRAGIKFGYGTAEATKPMDEALRKSDDPTFVAKLMREKP